jgi:hypothetical protein
VDKGIGVLVMQNIIVTLQVNLFTCPVPSPCDRKWQLLLDSTGMLFLFNYYYFSTFLPQSSLRFVCYIQAGLRGNWKQMESFTGSGTSPRSHIIVSIFKTAMQCGSDTWL